MLATRIYACLSNLFRILKRKYAFEDFAIRQVALFLNKTADEAKYANHSLVRAPFLVLQSQAFALKLAPISKNYRNIWDPDVTSDGFRGKVFYFGMF